jgi:hypothetical protein
VTDAQQPDLAATGAEMRAEWRAETEAATADAAEQHRRGRTLADWLAERAHAGDRIAVAVGSQRLAGLVEETGPDLIALRAVFGRVDVHLTNGSPLYIELVDHPDSGGERTPTTKSFYDALVARDGTEVTMATMHEPNGLDGVLTVGADFVSVVAKLGAETVLPIKYVLWVTARRN